MEIVKKEVILVNLLRIIVNYILLKLIYNYYNNLFNIEIILYN
jgi:hypothetical protein